VVEADGVAALDHPALDAAKTARTPQLTTLVQAFTTRRPDRHALLSLLT
jgi:hypothetical protein